MSDHPEKIIFCHGSPGSVRDLDILDLTDDVKRRATALDLYQRRMGSTEPVKSVLEEFDQVMRSSNAVSVHVIGFSIGAMFAAKIAAERTQIVSKLTLISPAAPLSLGNFLPDMAGKQVFYFARHRPFVFSLLTAMQGILTRLAPNGLAKQLFKNCGSQEQTLFQNPTFKGILLDGFKNSYIRHPKAYSETVKSYTDDWSACLSNITCPTTIYHGENDTWSPVAMAHALKLVIPSTVELKIIPRAEHYSTIQAARI